MAKRKDNTKSKSTQQNVVDDVSFDLVNEDTVARLKRDKKITVPEKTISVPKDERWNEKQMSSKLLQGIQNGDSIDKISHSLLKTVGNNEASAMRNARTMCTSAENHGRLDSYENLASQGVVMRKVWIATPDDRTRESHLDMDGEEAEIDEEFSNGCMFPGDGDCDDPAEVWNCRCAMRTNIIGFMREDGSISYINYDRDDTGHSEKIEDEKERRSEEEISKESDERVVVNGTDISKTWEHKLDKNGEIDEDTLDFEINDILHEQGFDGLPKVVDKEEFDRYVKESKFVAQRTYSAPNKEILDAYQNELYNGTWYVDCSTGGHAWGQGMYTAGNYNGKITKEIQQEMKDYQGQNLNYSGKSSVHNIETLTLDPSAKIIKYDKLEEMQEKEAEKAGNNAIKQLMKEYSNGSEGQKVAVEAKNGNYPSQAWFSTVSEKEYEEYRKAMDVLGETENKAYENVMATDIGSYAALKGYDAIRTNRGTCGADTIILNRTKVIFLKEE